MNPFGDPMHEPAVQNEQLRELVELARRQPPPRVNVELETIQRALHEHHARQRYGFAALAAAALVVITVASWWNERPVEPASSVAAPVAVREMHPPALIDADAANAVEVDAESGSIEGDVADRVTQTVLPPGVRVRSLSSGQGAPAPEVVGSWEVSVAAGRYVIDLDATAEQSLLIRVGDRVLEVEPGSKLELDVDRKPHFELERGRARWQTKAPKRQTPEELARLAESKMSAGNRKAARTVLERLIRSYPDHPESRTALLDLARLLRVTGQHDRARCAYELYRRRHGDSALHGELQRALAELGDGPACRGLDPRRTTR